MTRPSSGKLLEEALVLLGGADDQRQAGMAHLQKLIAGHANSREAERARELLASQRPYHPPSDTCRDWKNRWTRIQGIGSPALPRLLQEVFAAPSEPALETLKGVVAKTVAGWLDSETEAWRRAKPGTLPPDHETLAPSADATGAAPLLEALTRWREVATAHRLAWVQSKFAAAEAQTDPEQAAQALTELRNQPGAVVSGLQARLGALLARRHEISSALAACPDCAPTAWSDLFSRADAARRLAFLRESGVLNADDRQRVGAGLAAETLWRRQFLANRAQACRTPDDLAAWHANATTVSADPPAADDIAPALQQWVVSLSAALAGSTDPGHLEALAADLAGWRDRLPEPAVRWLDDRHAELCGYAQLWRDPTAGPAAIGLEPVLPPPAAVVDVIARYQLRQADVAALLADISQPEVTTEALEVALDRLAALADDLPDAPWCASAAFRAGDRLFYRHLAATLTGNRQPALRPLAERLARYGTEPDAQHYQTLLERWDTLTTLLEALSQRPRAPAGHLRRWSLAREAAAHLPLPIAAAVKHGIQSVRDAALAAVGRWLATTPEDSPLEEEPWLPILKQLVGSETDAGAAAHARSLAVAIHRRALAGALTNGQDAVIQTTLSALEEIGAAPDELERWRLRAALRSACVTGGAALFAFVRKRWDALRGTLAAPELGKIVADAAFAVAEDSREAGPASQLIGNTLGLAPLDTETLGRLERLRDWFALVTALTAGTPDDARDRLVAVLMTGVPNDLSTAFAALGHSPMVREEATIAVLFQCGGRRLSPPLEGGAVDPLDSLVARSRALATSVEQTLTGTDLLPPNALSAWRQRLSAEQTLWETLARSLAFLPFTVPTASPPAELAAAARHLGEALALFEEVEQIKDSDFRHPDSLNRLDLLREQCQHALPAGALRESLLTGLKQLEPMTRQPNHWRHWQALLKTIDHSRETGAFTAAAAALEAMRAGIAAAGLTGRRGEAALVRAAATAVASMGPALPPLMAEASLDGVIQVLHALEENEVVVRDALRAIRSAAPTVPVGGRLKERAQESQAFLKRFAMQEPLSHRAQARVQDLLEDQDFDFLRRVSRRCLPAWIVQLLRAYEDA